MTFGVHDLGVNSGPFQDLVWLSHGLTPSRARYLAMFVAYFDDGGHPSDSAVVSVGCVVAKASAWEIFNDKWARQLRRFKVSAFHMTDYESRQGEFSGWDHAKRVSCITNLIAIIHNSVSCGTACSVVMKDWLAVMPEQFDRPDAMATRGPYPVLMLMCIEQALKTITIEPPETLACVFDRNHYIRGALLETHEVVLKPEFYAHKLGALTFDSAERILPLQAADMLAYESHKHLRNHVVEGGRRPERKSHALLMNSDNMTSGSLTQEGLRAYCDEIRASLSS